MNRSQFEENKTKLTAKVATATYRYEKALEGYDNYKGTDTAEEHRLYLCWTSAEAAKITAEKKLNDLIAQYENRVAQA